ncbi:hypothetical protein HXX76_014880 [Chlamydomonas incerta]|uniref:Uncharacterized protein n=1 Tax=Chlamydomonas incerta TaxID=51695 RepID=A0A835SBI9_CHLIN|nr:hypothetical protein HXX76_014880 [Chlamydomonas incerta]|eukprot:KAG2423939.1 hypothetical protein HXX76_014880 [Chlamydomonas incerta]
MAGPPQRQPLVYSGDAMNSLNALRQDMTASYRALCAALGEPERADLVGGYLPAAAALGLPLPAPPVGGIGGGLQRLPPLPGASSGITAPLAIMSSPRDAAGAGAGPDAGEANYAAASGAGLGVAGLGGMMLAGDAGGIESVGSGADAPARMLGAHRSMSAGAGNPYAMQNVPSLAHLGGAARAGALGSGFGLPPIGGGMQQQQQMWPLGRPSWPHLGGAGGGGALQGIGIGGGGGGSMAALNGPRVSVMSGFSRPQDVGSDFLGEESALVYPPAGRSFGGGPSAAARAALGPGIGGGGLIDPMDDFRFRGGGPRKAITVDQLDDLDSLVPGRLRLQHGSSGEQLDRYLQDYARDRAKAPSMQALMSGNRFNMPF